MGERIAALAALSRIRALVEQIPTQAASPAQEPIEVQEAAVPQSAQAITASRPLQELAGLRQMAETTSQSTSPNINAQRVDRLGAALSRLAESTVDPPNAIEPRQSVADVLDAGAGNRLSYNRAILEMLRGGFETARRAVPAVEAQREAFREAMLARRAEALRREAAAPAARSGAQNLAAAVTRAEADALGLFAGASGVPLTRPPQTPYRAEREAPEGAGNRLNFLV